jgi:hypothetical protein
MRHAAGILPGILAHCKHNNLIALQGLFVEKNLAKLVLVALLGCRDTCSATEKTTSKARLVL